MKNEHNCSKTNPNTGFKISHIKAYDDELTNLITKHPTDFYHIAFIRKDSPYDKDKLLKYINDNTPCLSDPKYTIATKIYWILHDITTFPECEVCKDPIVRNVKSVTYGYFPFDGETKEPIPISCCSNQCTQRHPKMNEHRKKCCQRKYGVDNVFQLEEMKRKAARTLFEKTGYFHNTSDPKIKRQREESYFKKTGYKNPGQNPEVKAKMKETSIRTYGYAHPNSNPLKSKQNALAICSITFNRMLKFDKYCIPLFDQYEYAEFQMKFGHVYDFKCKICGREFKSPFVQEINRHHLKIKTGRCPFCFPKVRNTSRDELEIVSICSEMCDKLGYTLKHNDKRVIRIGRRRLDVDIHIPELKLLIEYDGYYYHSNEYYEERLKDRPTRLAWKKINKTIEAEKLGLRLLHVDEWDWLNNREETEKLIRDTIMGTTWYDQTAGFLIVNRNLHNKADMPTGFTLIGETGPITSKYRHLHVENCGYLFYQRDIKCLT